MRVQLLFVLCAALFAVCAVNATVQLKVDWGKTVGDASGLEYGGNDFQGTYSNMADSKFATYSANQVKMGIPLVRIHNDKIQDRWFTDGKWDKAKIAKTFSTYTQMSAKDKPMIVMSIPHPKDGTEGYSQGGTRQITNVAAYASLCASLVDIINKQLGLGVVYWEPVNEIDDQYYYSKNNELGTVIKTVVAAMKKVDPNIKISAPAYSTIFKYKDDKTIITDKLVKLFSTFVPDVLSFHRYGLAKSTNTDDDYALMKQSQIFSTMCRSLNDEVVKALGKRLPLFLSEYNMDSSSSPFEPRQQELMNAPFIASVHKHMVEGGCDWGAIFNLWNENYGVLEDDLYFKPPAYVMQLSNQYMVGSAKSVSTTATDNMVEGFAIQQKSGAQAFYVINKLNSKQTITVSAVSGSFGKSGLTTKTITDSGINSGTLAASSSSTFTLTLDPYTVVLLYDSKGSPSPPSPSPTSAPTPVATPTNAPSAPTTAPKPAPTSAPTKAPTPVPTPARKFTVTDVLASIAWWRQHYGLKKLTVYSGLTKIAKKHASYMAKKKKVTVSPSIGGRAETKKYYKPYSFLGETVAAAVPTVLGSKIVEGWLASSSYAAKLKSTKAVNVGCALASAGGKYYVSCEFGAKKKKSRDVSEDVVVDNSTRDSSDMIIDDYSENSADWPTDDKMATAETAAVDLTVGGICDNAECNDDESTWNSMKCLLNNLCADPECVPLASCATTNQTCGFIFDGCSKVDCGACAVNEVCRKNKCEPTACAQGCPNNAKCENGACVCPSGSSVQDGECAPTTILSDTPSYELSSYTLSGTWTTNYQEDTTEYDEDGNTTTAAVVPEVESVVGLRGYGLALWQSSDKVSGQVTVFSSTVQLLEESKSIALVFRAIDENNYLFFKYEASELFFGSVVDGKSNSKKVGDFTWVVDDSHKMSVVLRGNSYELLVDDVRYPSTNTISTKGDGVATGGKVGFYADGTAAFGDVNYRSRVLVELSHPCPVDVYESEALVAKVAWALQLDESQITIPICNARRRDATATTSMYIEGSADYAAENIGSDLATYSQTGDAVMAENSLTIEAVTTASDVAVGAEASEFVIAATAAAAGAVAAGVIAGIVVASTAGAAAVVVGGVVVHKKRQQRKNVKEEEPAAKKPKGAGANVFDFDATNHTSITGRSPAVKV